MKIGFISYIAEALFTKLFSRYSQLFSGALISKVLPQICFGIMNLSPFFLNLNTLPVSNLALAHEFISVQFDKGCIGSKEQDHCDRLS